jgi:two-component system response regulator
VEQVDVLLAEANVGDILQTLTALEECRMPVTLHVARDGEQALDILSKTRFKLDLVVLDPNLPRVSSHALIAQCHRQNLPVVVFSSFCNEAVRQRAIAMGASDCVYKPMDLASFAAAVQGILERWAFRSQQSERKAAAVAC